MATANKCDNLFFLILFQAIIFLFSVAKFNWKLVTHFCLVVFALEWKIEISDVYTKIFSRLFSFVFKNVRSRYFSCCCSSLIGFLKTFSCSFFYFVLLVKRENENWLEVKTHIWISCVFIQNKSDALKIVTTTN